MIRTSALQAQQDPAVVSRDPRYEARPLLLDRLTNHRLSAMSDTGGSTTLARTPVRESMLRDLGWLMDTTNLEATVNLDAYPHVRRSVLNFGICTLTGARKSATDWTAIESAIRDAILLFEPRIVAESLEVRGVVQPPAAWRRNALSLEIHGQWWSTTSPQAFLLRAEFDPESGHVMLHSHGNR